MPIVARHRPMLMVNFSRKGDVYCSVCGNGFPLHGSAEALIDAFTFHVQRRHIREGKPQEQPDLKPSLHTTDDLEGKLDPKDISSRAREHHPMGVFNKFGGFG